ncbi:hypothetical protein KEM54_006509 [Ascosphaera aggregata]|nr:hypothetical protein KEM54_006509 [Ascosphaera aggregata]
MESIDVYVVTFNCGRARVKPEEFGAALFGALPQRPQKGFLTSTQTSPGENTYSDVDISQYPQLLVLSLQELAPIAYSYLGGRFLNYYFNGFHEAVAVATRGRQVYRNIVCENTGMTAIMVFARKDVVHEVVWVETAGAGVGVQETGHKGAAGVRLGYSVKGTQRDGAQTAEQQTIALTFVAAHLAPGEALLERRNEDWKKLIKLMVFSGSRDEGIDGQYARQSLTEEAAPLHQLPRNTRGLYSPQSYLFVAGDFNYRTASLGPKPEDYDTFPQPTEDPDNPLHYRHLLSRDQLTRERANQRTFHHLSEMPINFPPTYKIIHLPEGTPSIVHKAYNWARNRWPSWCDRILYADASASRGFEGLKPRSYNSLSVMSTSDHLPVAFLASVALKAIPAPDEGDALKPPFEIDSKWRDRRVAARRKEILAGALFYLGLTREGNLLFFLATILLGTIYRNL